MNELRTRIVLRNDSTVNWLANESVVLLKGEIGVEFLADGKTKLKIGDGIKTWTDLEYFGGEVLVGDNSTIVVDGQIISLVGFDEAEVGAQLVKGSDGKLSWVVPSTETVEGLQTTVATLQQDVENINGVLFPTEEGSKTLLSRVETLEEESATVDQRITDSINDFAAKISDDGTVNTLKELVDYVAEHGAETSAIVDDITELQGLVGTTSVSEQISVASDSLLAEIAQAEKRAIAISEQKEYEVAYKPDGTLVDYRDKEIRVMCPADTVWTLQESGATADPSLYYIGFKAYAPNADVVSFKEDLAQTISDENMYEFEGNDFAGIDEYGRKYSVVWLPVAQYNETTQTWTYYGAQSSTSRFIGWYYSVEWYNAEGEKVGADTIRINLSNEACHNSIEPYYMGNVVKSVKVNGTLLDIVNGEVEIEVPVIKSSTDMNKISIAEDGTMEVNSINANKIVQDDGEFLILNGGDASI